ncbi:small ribosomal subunit protein eS17-like [Notamacropus eugenii]|uniref:small ribosomal subunit protein eS17-like n=1 Tax=Notamacropus eugenii TaxID=9315 RepID=UPI003B67A939
MGQFQPKTMKKVACVIIKKCYMHLGNKFHINELACEEIAIIPSKKLCNKIEDYVPHLMKQIQRVPMSGILQEEERERKDNYVPEVSALDQEITEVNHDTREILKLLDFDSLCNLQVT